MREILPKDSWKQNQIYLDKNKNYIYIVDIVNINKRVRDYRSWILNMQLPLLYVHVLVSVGPTHTFCIPLYSYSSSSLLLLCFFFFFLTWFESVWVFFIFYFFHPTASPPLFHRWQNRTRWNVVTFSFFFIYVLYFLSFERVSYRPLCKRRGEE